MAPLHDILAQCTGFDWDAGNAEKNLELQRVARTESEQPFFNRPVLVTSDERHSGRETRYAALGQTNTGRLLTIVLTVRGTLIRVISARDMTRRERRIDEDARQGRKETDA
jgi:uncharacterized DUF497 family protein